MTTTTRLHGPRSAALLLAIVALFVAFAPAASGQDALEVELKDARLERDGATRLVVEVDGTGESLLDSDAFTVLEDGQDVGTVEAQPLTETGDVDVVVVLAFDLSGSMRPVMDEARQAALAFVETLPDFVEVIIVGFADEVESLIGPTDDRVALAAEIDALEAGGATPLYDAIVESSDILAQFPEDTLTRLVILSDGGDAFSVSSIDDAIGAANDAELGIVTVALETEDLDPEALATMADATGGRVIQVADADALAGAFEDVASGIGSEYVVSYTSSITQPSELPVTVIVESEAGRGEVDSFAINTRTAAAQVPTELPSSTAPSPIVEIFGSSVGLWVGVAAVFIGALTILWLLLVSPVRSAGSRTLERGLRIYDRKGRREPDELVLPTARLTERAIDLVGRVPKPRGFDERLQLRLDRASWPVRTNEFLLLVAATTILGGLFLGGLARSLPIAIMGAVLAGAAPIAVLQIKISRRRRAFMEQLPSTLQLLAGSLRAGYGLLQAIDTVVKEGEDPTSVEFARVLTEARLGMPLEESLEGMAQRLDSDDFHWVVLAIGIQREVGGNLAELLTTVAETMRNRASLRRHIQTLSAEGRISAWIIGLMPFIVALALSVLSPGYLDPLVQRIEGILMLAGGAVLLLVGAVWLRRLIAIEV